MAEFEYPEPGDHVLVLLPMCNRFYNGTVSDCDSLGFAVCQSWNHRWDYAGFGKTWLWDDGSGRVVDLRTLTAEDLAVPRRAGRREA